MPDDTTAHDLDSATSTSVAERPADAVEGSTVNSVSSQSSHQPPQPARSEAPSLDEKPSTTEDFASALESFTAESEEAAREDNVIKGTVLKITATHVVVDIGAKSEGMLPLAEVLDHTGNPKFKPGDEIVTGPFKTLRQVKEGDKVLVENEKAPGEGKGPKVS